MATNYGFRFSNSNTIPSLQKILTFSELEPHVKQHVKRVYSTLTISVLAATVGAYIHLCTNFMQAGLLSVLGSLACMGAVAMIPNHPKNQVKRLGFLAGFSLLTGMGLGPLLDMAISIDPSIIVTALLGTTFIFTCFSISALISNRRSYIYLGGFLMTGMSWMLAMTLMNIFFRSQMLFQIELYFGLAVMCGFVLYDTQLIVEKCRNGDMDYIWHSIELFVDMVQIFRRLLIILSQKESDKKKKN